MSRSTLPSNTDLFHEDEGTGKALVFVPGLGATHEMFKPQVDAFRGSHRLIRTDLRGNGRSARLVGPIGTILDRQCDDMAALLDHLGIIRVVMIGVSYGGTVALHFALRHPDRLAGLVIVDSFAELRITQPMEALLLAGSYLTLWTYYLPRPLLKSMARLFYRRWPTALAAIPALVVLKLRFLTPPDQITARYSLGCDCRSCLASTFRPVGVSIFSASSFSSRCSAS